MFGVLKLGKLGASMKKAGFDPRALFSASEPGVWYDPSDMSTLFQDAAGTTPVTAVEQPVGLMLDKSRPLGPNLAPSTSSLSGWTLNQTGGSVTVVDGGLFLNTTGTGAVTASFPGLLTSARYMFEFEVVSVSGLMYLEYGAGGVAKILTPGKHRWCVTGRTAFYLRNSGPSATSGSLLIKNVVVRAAPGSHAVQPTTTARPILSARYNILTDTAFTSPVEWGIGNWVFSGGEEDPFGGAAAAKVQMGDGAAQAPARIIGSVAGDVVFRVWWKAGNQASVFLAARDDTTATMLGTVRCDTGGVTGTLTGSIIRQQNGFNLVELRTVGFPPGNVLRIYIGGSGGVPAGTHSFWYGPDLRLVCDADEGPTYQYVAPAAASYEVAGFSRYLRFDGVDDWMQTGASMDLSGTSEVVAMTAVKVPAHKTTRGTVFEIGTSYANNGCFGMEAPMFSAAAVGVGYRGNGSETARSVSSTDSIPISAVFVASLYLHDPAFQLRADGENKQLSSVSVGSGPFANATAFIGSRNGNSQRFEGSLYGILVCGRRLTSAEIGIVEQFMRNKSRAY